jgi:peroxiredoxin (alkyl hydroperoxide reductase subunit C)
MDIRVGEQAPHLTVQAWFRDEFDAVPVSLPVPGRWTVLFFYPRDFTFVCPTEIAAFAEHTEEFERHGADVVAASTDSFWCHRAWYSSDDRLASVDYPVVADTSHELSRAFGVLLEDGSALRGTFIIDDAGTVRYASVTDLSVGRSVAETLRVLQALQTGELCPAGWRPGLPTLSLAS